MNEIPEGLLLLQQEVPENLVGKLPKVTCPLCRKKENRGECNEHKKQRCEICDGWLTSAHMHLDYVGHAETTSKLLEVDPLWNWEPLAFGSDGLPAFDANGGLWIKLTVCGVTRLGYGTADNANGFKARGDLVKELIGDAIRNAAMRYGWALNLWAKTDIHERTPQEEPAPPPPPLASLEQKRDLAILIGQKLGPQASARRHAVMSQRFQRNITSFDELLAVEAVTSIGELKKKPDYKVPDTELRYAELRHALNQAPLEGIDPVMHAVMAARDDHQITQEHCQQLTELAEGRAQALVADGAAEGAWTPEGAQQGVPV